MKLGLVIDLDTCVGCQACAVACKQWNTSGTTGPLSDINAYDAEPSGTWFNRIRTYEYQPNETVKQNPNTQQSANNNEQHRKTVHMPMSCMQCEDAHCVSVCPTGATYKRAEDGIVLIDQDKCMGCNYCAWACPYGARELDQESGTMKKCTLCIDRIYDEQLPKELRQPACVLTCPTNARLFGDFDDPDSDVSKAVKSREGKQLIPELGYNPVNHYLPPKPEPRIEQMKKNENNQTSREYISNWINKLISR